MTGLTDGPLLALSRAGAGGLISGSGYLRKSGFSRVKFCSAFLLAAFLSLSGPGAGTIARAEGPRHAAMIIDANSGKVLHDANADEPRYPASLTKLMTLYLAFEAIEQGRLSLDTELTVSEAAASVAPSKLELAPGETITLADAIKALVTKSANDMAVAVAEKIAGDERTFAELMTKRARQIGMRATTFRNASGLPDSEQVTTARDMLTLALRIYDDFPAKARVFSLREFTYRGKTYRTHNTLMRSFAGMDGMKTGYTRASGFNLVTSVHRDGKHLVAAVFGGATASSRNAHMRQILNSALDDASTEKTRIAKPQLIASVRPAERRQKDDASQPKKTVVAANVPQPKPAVKPAPKPAAPKQEAAAKPAAEMKAVSVTPPAAAPPKQPEQSISVAPPVEAQAARLPDEPQQSVSVSPPIVVASVRTIAISPEPVAQPSTAPDVSPATIAPTPPAQVAAASIAPKLDFAALRKAITGKAAVEARPAKAAREVSPAPAATTPARDDETIVAKVEGSTVAGRPPSTLGNQAALLTQGAAEAPMGGAVAQEVAFTSLARPPSTLEAQASAAEATTPVATHSQAMAAINPPMGLNGPAAAAAPAIQIGAYASEQEAGRQLEALRARAAAVLGGTTPMTRRIESGGRQLFAARFGGLDQAAASKACLELQKQSIDCFVVSSK